MKRDVTISVKGNQAPPYSDEVIETISTGRYTKRNGKIYVKYEEIAGDNDRMDCLLKVYDNAVEIIKKGAVGFYMYFEKDKECVTSFVTFLGNITVGVLTKELIILEDKDEIIIKILYEMTMGAGGYSDNSVDIHIRSVENAPVEG